MKLEYVIQSKGSDVETISPGREVAELVAKLANSISAHWWCPRTAAR